MPDRAKREAYVGQPVERVEDAALLSGSAVFSDDMGVRPGTLHGAILRSPHAHAEIVGIDTTQAETQTRNAARSRVSASSALSCAA